ncbi:NAD-dependent epimerase/dehydratase family protein [Allopontixanthobacter sediminis]|uniref:NAD-dependent epimerase/dehydratase family protein n=1 Tax=Allopontixanthobacter sediminis TaxID=1689985 RepID=A0A845B2J6_9SPHN|nr:NAD-dependent epimerase/dehydratase family protein [Allopontixanthobacter sediminis]MXP43842.1 NAD-dependent epimerase/dehydratase family protein [Allopontixanthobacter sediminis]
MAGTVLVTGGTGYIAGELIDQLLARGWTVNTTVRSRAKNETRLHTRWPNAGNRLKVFEADLLADAGWAEANKGCTHAAHVASPFPLAVPKNEDELIVPARDGTLRALRFAHAAGVTRFVQTSSAAAIAYGHPPSQTRFDESDWTDVDNPATAEYPKSKTVAERAARDWVAEYAPEMVFCSVNPVAVLGPVHDDDLSTSIEFVRKALDGSMPMIPNVGVGIVDVRDVAALHVLALEAPDHLVRGERFAASGPFVWLADIARTLRENLTPLHARKVPTRRMPDFLVPVLALFMPEMRQLRTEMGRVREIDASNAMKTLGWTMIDSEKTILDTARSLIDQRIVKL